MFVGDSLVSTSRDGLVMSENIYSFSTKINNMNQTVDEKSKFKRILFVNTVGERIEPVNIGIAHYLSNLCDGSYYVDFLFILTDKTKNIYSSSILPYLNDLFGASCEGKVNVSYVSVNPKYLSSILENVYANDLFSKYLKNHDLDYVVYVNLTSGTKVMSLGAHIIGSIFRDKSRVFYVYEEDGSIVEIPSFDFIKIIKENKLIDKRSKTNIKKSLAYYVLFYLNNHGSRYVTLNDILQYIKGEKHIKKRKSDGEVLRRILSNLEFLGLVESRFSSNNASKKEYCITEKGKYLYYMTTLYFNHIQEFLKK